MPKRSSTDQSAESLAIPLHIGQDHEPRLRIFILVDDLVRLFFMLEHVIHPALRPHNTIQHEQASKKSDREVDSPLDPARGKAVDVRPDHVPINLGGLVNHEPLLGRVLSTRHVSNYQYLGINMAKTRWTRGRTFLM